MKGAARTNKKSANRTSSHGLTRQYQSLSANPLNSFEDRTSIAPKRQAAPLATGLSCRPAPGSKNMLLPLKKPRHLGYALLSSTGKLKLPRRVHRGRPHVLLFKAFKKRVYLARQVACLLPCLLDHGITGGWNMSFCVVIDNACSSFVVPAPGIGDLACDILQHGGQLPQ